MRRSAFVFAPVLAATAVTVLSGCHEAKALHEPVLGYSEDATETRRAGFGGSFDSDTVFWILTVAGVIVVARFSGIGE